jgi:hypothetical protein
MAKIDASSVPPQFSEDGGTTWLTVVCIKNWSLDGNTPSTEEETFCGKVTGLGEPGYTGTATAIGEFAPGVDAVSMEKMQSWWFNKTALKFMAESPDGTGTDFYVAGDAYITSFKPSFEVANSAAFDFGWTVSNTDIIK